MMRIALLNLPFSEACFPSLALTQLKAVLEARFADRVEVRILYLNHHFAHYFGLETYAAISGSVEATVQGFGDWFFSSVAFPDAPDQSEAYLQRHHRRPDQREVLRKNDLVAKRREIGGFLDQLIADHGLDGYDLVGCTSMFQQNMACFAMARKLKELRPEIVTAIGGANCETPMGEVIASNVEAIDFVFSGPSLVTFRDFVGHLLEGDLEKCHDLRGVFSREKLEREDADRAPEVGEELPIDVEVRLDYDDFLEAMDQSFPAGDIEPVLFFETSRGCWWGERSHCTFCGLNGLTMRYRAMSSDTAIQLFRRLFADFPQIKRFDAVDNIMPRPFLTEVLPEIEAPEGVRIFYEVKADLKAHEMATMAKAGVRLIQPGIEALATSTLRLMKKGTTSFQNLTFLSNCRTYGIQPAWNILVGFPGEQEDVYRKYVEDLPLLVHLPPPMGTYPVRFDRYSPYFKEATEHGLKLKPYPFYGMLYPFSEEDLAELAYFFVDENYAAAYALAMTGWIDSLRRLVTDWQQRWEGDGAVPELRYRESGGSTQVYDTRGGDPLVHSLTTPQLRLLRHLEKPSKLPRAARSLGELPEAFWRRQLATLQEMGLVFQEGDLFYSLVLDAEVAPEAVLPKALQGAA